MTVRLTASLQNVSLPTLEDEIESFLLSRRASGLSKNTLTQYRYQLDRFVQHVKVRRLSEVTPDHLRLLQIALQEKGLAPNTVKNTRRCVNTLLNWAEQEELLKRNPAAKVPLPKVPKNLLKPITEDNLKKIFSVLKGKSVYKIRDRAIFYIWLDTGLRIHELAGLKVGQVQSCGTLYVRGKGAKERSVFLSAPTMVHYKTYLAIRGGETGDPLWLSQQGVMTRSGLLTWIRTLRAKVGFHFTSHDIRRTFAILSLRNGADLLSVSRQLGHSDIATTQIYLFQDAEDLRRVHRNSSPVANLSNNCQSMANISLGLK